MYRNREPFQDLAEQGIVAGSPVIGQVAGDDHAVRTDLQTEYATKRPMETGDRLRAECSGRDVRIAQLRDQHGPPP
jgi:hypothetical protein